MTDGFQSILGTHSIAMNAAAVRLRGVIAPTVVLSFALAVPFLEFPIH